MGLDAEMTLLDMEKDTFVKFVTKYGVRALVLTLDGRWYVKGIEWVHFYKYCRKLSAL